MAHGFASLIWTIGVLAQAAPPADSAVGEASRRVDRAQLSVAESDWDRGTGGRGRPAATQRETRAIEFISEFYRRGNTNSPESYAFYAQAYLPEVTYYGKKRTRAEVLADKFAWMKRWPERDYRVRRESADWQCKDGARLCLVRVLIDYEARNPTTGKVARGVTTSELGVVISDDGVQIGFETGTVVSRQ